MTDSPRTVSRTRKLARKVVPLRVRRRFVTTVDTRLKKEGKHHKVAPASRLIADWDVCSDPPEESCADAGCPIHGDGEPEQEATEAAAWRASPAMTAATLLSEGQRREELTALARNWEGYGTTVRCLRLIDLVDGELLKDPCLADFWDVFLGEVALLDGINGEPWAVEADWRQVNDELTCPDRTEAARDEMEMRVAGVLDVLARGIQ